MSNNKRRPLISDPLEAAKVAQFEMPEDESEAPVMDATSATSEAPAMPLPAMSKPTARYRVKATTKVFGRGGMTIMVYKDKIVSEADGAELFALLRESNVPLELID